MNNVSFGSNEYGKYFYEAQDKTQKTYTPRSRRINPQVNFEPPTYYGAPYGGDSFEKSTQPKKSQPSTKKAPAKKAPAKKYIKLTPLQTLGLVLAGLGAGVTGVGIPTAASNYEPKPEIGIYGEITDADQLEYVANLYGSDEDLILAYNDAESVEDLADKSQVGVPKLFNPMQEKIDVLEAKLYDKNLTVEEQLSLQDEIEALKDKQQAQKDAAWAYQDGNNVFFIMNETINAEDFKKIYGIEDGALSDYNNLECTYESVDHGPGENASHYRDYTGASLHKGETYKVKVSNFID